MREIFTEYEFKQWVDELGAEEDPALEVVKDYEIVMQQSQLDRWIVKLEGAKRIAFGAETSSFDYMEARLVGLSFAIDVDTACYLPVAHDYVGAPDQLDLNEVLRRVKPLLENPSIVKIGQDLKYDMSVMARYGIGIAGIGFDAMLASYVLNSIASKHSRDDLALKYLGITCIGFEDIAGKGKRQLPFNQIEVDVAGQYAAEGVDITMQLYNELWPRLEAEPNLKTVFEEIEIPLLTVLSRVERNGVLLDRQLLNSQSEKLARRLAELQQEAFELAGEEFNLGSPKQLQTIFFEKLGLPVIRKTPKGQPSTAEPVLQELALDYPLPRVIMEYRGLSKLKSTYTDQLPNQIHQSTKRVHTSYHQAVAATGRLSSQNPNLQNIPIRTEEGRRVRKAFIAPEGYRLIAADYSQIELRIMAHLSRDEGLVTAFKAGEDIHRATAAEVFGVALSNVKDNQRRSAKAINFGLIYGMSAFGLARQLSISRIKAQEYVDLYFERYPGVRNYMDETRRLAAEQGFVETLFGRRLYLPEINASNFQRRQAAERTAINAPMQGTAADIIKMAMLQVDKWLMDTGIDAIMIMQVHDELVLETAIDEIDTVKEALIRIMSETAELSIPLVVDCGVGKDWEAAH